MWDMMIIKTSYDLYQLVSSKSRGLLDWTIERLSSLMMEFIFGTFKFVVIIIGSSLMVSAGIIILDFTGAISIHDSASFIEELIRSLR